MAQNPLPPLQVQAAFASTPLSASPTWSDISKLVKSLKIDRGRQHELARTEAGKLTLTCWGVDRSLDPSNSSGPYYPNVDANKQIQVNAIWNLLTEAQAGGTLDWVTSGISAGWTGTNATLTYGGGYLLIKAASAANMNAFSSIGTTFAYGYVQPGNTYTGMASFWAGNASTNTAGTARSCQVSIAFFNAAFTQLSSQAGSPANDTAAKSGGLPVWTTLSVQATAPAGAVYAAITLSVTSPANTETHSVQQPAIFPAVGAGGQVAPVPSVAPPGGVVQLFTGYIDTINPLWTNNLSTDVQIAATDSLRLLDQDYVPSVYRSTIIADGATWCWPFGDSVGSAASEIIAGLNGTYFNPSTLGEQGPNFTDPTTAVLFGAGGYVRTPGLGTVTTPVSVEVWFNTTNVLSSGQTAALWGSVPPLNPGSFVVVGHAQTTQGTASTTIVVTYASTTGNTLICTVFAAGATGVTDSASNSWVKLVDNGTNLQIWGAYNATAVTSVTVAMPSGEGTASVMEFGGVISPAIVDRTGSSGPGGATWSDATGGLAVAGEYFVGIVEGGAFGSTPPSFVPSSPSNLVNLTTQQFTSGGTSAGTLTSYAAIPGSGSITYAGTANGAGLGSYTAWITIKPLASTPFIALRIGSAGNVEALAYDGTNLKTVDSPSGLSYTDGFWHHAVLTISAGNVMTLYVDGVSKGTVSGVVSSIAASQPEWSDPTATLQGDMSYGTIYEGTALTGTQVLTHYHEGFTGFPLQDSITRANTVMTQLGALAPPDNFGVGITIVQQPSSDLSATSVVTYLQSLEQTENGFLYTDASGILQFLNRYAPITAPRNVSLGVFGENSGEVPYLSKPDVGVDNLDLFASSYVQALQGLTFGVPQTASSPTAETKYGANATLVETGLLLTSDFEALNRAQWNVGLYSSTKMRARSITIEPLGDPATRMPQVLYREILDRVTIRRRPWDSTSGTFGSPLFQQDQNIEGVSHDIDKQTPKWQTTYRTWPALIAQFWVLGDPVLGVLGSTTTLAY